MYSLSTLEGFLLYIVLLSVNAFILGDSSLHIQPIEIFHHNDYVSRIVYIT